jgi:hypothetical protein
VLGEPAAQTPLCWCQRRSKTLPTELWHFPADVGTESRGVEAGLLAPTWAGCLANDRRRAFTALHSLDTKEGSLPTVFQAGRWKFVGTTASRWSAAGAYAVPYLGNAAMNFGAYNLSSPQRLAQITVNSCQIHETHGRPRLRVGARIFIFVPEASAGTNGLGGPASKRTPVVRVSPDIVRFMRR